MKATLFATRMARLPIGLLVCSATVALAAVPSPRDVRELAKALLPHLGRPVAPGEVLFHDDFSTGKIEDRWKPEGWTIVDLPEGGGRCATDQQLPGGGYQNLNLKAPIPLRPGHPVAVYWRVRGVAPDSETVWIKTSFSGDKADAGGVMQVTSWQGREWTENVVLISDYAPEAATHMHLSFFLGLNRTATAQLDDIKVVDLYGAALESVAGRRAECAKLAREREAQAGQLADGVPAASWKQAIPQHCRRIGERLAQTEKLAPGRPETVRALAEAEIYLARFRDVLESLRRKEGAIGNGVVAYSTKAIASRMVLPQTVDLPVTDSAGRMRLMACPGEITSAGLVLWTPDELKGALPTASDLSGPAEVIPAVNIDFKWVKCWHQGSTAPHWWQRSLKKALIPELLLNDDDLVRVDRGKERTLLRLSFPEGDRHADISEPAPWTEKHQYSGRSIAEFPVRDSARLRPADLPAGENKQVWLTIKVPDATPAGRYAGTVRVEAGERKLAEITMDIDVLPWRLPAPRTHYDSSREYTGGIYYWGRLDPEGTGRVGGYFWKNERQLRAELRLMRAHNITAPALAGLDITAEEPYLRRHLAILREEGFGGTLYLASSGTLLTGGQPTTKPDDLEALRARVRRVLGLAKEYGFTKVYFYGVDEAGPDLVRQLVPSYKLVPEEGGEVMQSGCPGMVSLAGPVLGVFNASHPAAHGEVAAYHSHGTRVFNYGNPQAVCEDPEMWRRNYGLYNWRHDLDGACTYCFSESTNCSWNDFDHPLREMSAAYPTMDGVVGTLQLAGFREALNDVRYATKLRLVIEEVERTGSAAQKEHAAAAAAWLKGLPLVYGGCSALGTPANIADLDSIRAEMVKWIERLSRN